MVIFGESYFFLLATDACISLAIVPTLYEDIIIQPGEVNILIVSHVLSVE